MENMSISVELDDKEDQWEFYSVERIVELIGRYAFVHAVASNLVTKGKIERLTKHLARRDTSKLQGEKIEIKKDDDLDKMFFFLGAAVVSINLECVEEICCLIAQRYQEMHRNGKISGSAVANEEPKEEEDDE